MHVKRILSAALTLTLLCGVLPARAADVPFTPFTDLQDPQVSEAAEFLRLMGVVDGTGYNAFTPDRILTRAEFCKMAVELMGNGDKVAAQMNRTVFRDVPSTHWARGYINVATQVTVSGDTTAPGIIRGDATGLFHPDDHITAAEAVTILMRVLNYSDSTVGFGVNWYDGYMSTAASAGLTEGLTLDPLSTVTRGQAAILLYNVYFTELYGSKDTYLIAKGGKEAEGGVILDVDAKADDGSYAVKTTQDTYKTDRTFSAALEGREGKAVLDSDGKLVAFQPKEGTSSRVVNITSTEATYLMASGGEKITVEPETVVYRDGKTSTWKETYLNISSSTPVTFHYGANGKLSHLFFGSADAEETSSLVARTAPNGGNPFASMAGSGSYTMFKNGVAATAADLRQWDVATWDPGTRVLQVSDLKLTGVYENASPSPAAPITITVMGKDFPVLSSARNDLSSFKVGDRITLLLTVDNQVAGVVSADTVRGEAVGIASVSDKSATVKLLQGGLEVSGEISGSAERYDNQLVTVTSSAIGRLSLNLVSGSAVRGALDVAQRKLGDREIAENVVVYDRVQDGKAVEVKYDSLTASIPQSKIDFVSYDYAGRVKCLVLRDATGDAYEYGYFEYTREKTERVPEYEKNPDGTYKEGPDGNWIISGYHTETTAAPTLCVKQADSSGKETTTQAANFLGSVRTNIPGGIAYNAKGKIAATVALESLTNVKRSAFDSEEMTVTVAGISYPISDKVQCYNKTTKTWFKPGEEGMEAARAYSDDLTLYYDRAPEDGGKIRMIVIP